MKYDTCILDDMKGKILLTDNKAFLCCASFIGVYYVTFLYFLLHTILQSGQLH